MTIEEKQEICGCQFDKFFESYKSEPCLKVENKTDGLS